MEKEDKLRLDSHKIKNFSGKAEDWQRWKSGTNVTFSSTGYGEVLERKKCAQRHISKNKVVFAQLSGAVNDGTARHLVEAYSETKDGHEAWKALLAWYDGSNVQAALAASIRKQLYATELNTGTSASEYINSFKVKETELDRIPGEYMSEYQYRDVFIQNILDPDYAGIKENLEIGLANNSQTLNDMIETLHAKEARLIDNRRSTGGYRRPRRQREGSESEEDEDLDSNYRRKVRRLEKII